MTGRDIDAEVELDGRTGSQVGGRGGKLQYSKTKISTTFIGSRSEVCLVHHNGFSSMLEF